MSESNPANADARDDAVQNIPLVALTALDDVGQRILARVDTKTWQERARAPPDVRPDPMEIVLDIRIGERPRAAPCSADLQVLVGRESMGVCPDGVVVVGDEDWLVRVVLAMGQVIEQSRRFGIDYADFCALFRGKGPVQGCSVAGERLDDVARAACASCGALLKTARSVLVHVEGGGVGLYDINTAACMAQELAPDDADVCFNYQPSDTEPRVTLMIA